VMTRQFRGMIREDLVAGGTEMVRVWSLTRQVPPATALEAAIEASYKRLVVASVMAFGQRVYAQGKAHGLPIELKEEDFASRMMRYALSYVAREAIRRRITGVSETTRNLILVAVAEGLAKGDPIDAIAEAILDALPGISKWRAEMIARTETHAAANFGANEAAKATGLRMQKEWNASGDENTRDTHVEADGQVVDMDARFAVGDDQLDYPGDPNGSPQETINCRCAISHIVADDEDQA